MNYEEAYKKALEKAKNLENTTAEENALIDYLFPELKDGEDEKIRKQLIDEVKEQINNIPAPDCCNSDDLKRLTILESWLAYLEKHKEQQPTECLKPERDCWYVCIKDFYGGGKKQSSKGDLVRAKGGMYMMSRDDISEWFRKAYYDEIKSAEWSEEDEHCMHQLILFCENCMQQDSEAIRCSTWLKSLPERFNPQPKQEWSEEDKDYYDAIIAKLEVTQDDAMLTDNQIDFLKSLPEKFNLHPKQEWSEDEKTRKGLIHHLKELRDWKVGTMSPIKVREHYDAWISYLEKHKENKFTFSDIEKEFNRLWDEGKLGEELEGPHNIYDVMLNVALYFANWKK